MRVRIHRGAHQIGGNCIEVEAGGCRIVLDVGKPLDAAWGEVVPLPDVPGLKTGDDPNLVGLLISHGHQDHWGLIDQVSPKVHVYIGEATSSMLREALFFSKAGIVLNPAGFLKHRAPFELGPFRITPFLNDHNGFDAYSMLIETDGKRLFYSGDFQGHGRKSDIFEELLRKPPKNVDVMLMEGTNVREGGAAGLEPSEEDAETAFVDHFTQAKGMVLVIYSSQSIDRLVTIYRAAKRTGKTLVVDLYTATMAEATMHPTIPRPGFERLAVYVPQRQRIQVKQASEFSRVEKIKPYRLFAEDLARDKSKLVMTFRESMAKELVTAGCLERASAIWSMWPGYLEDSSGTRLREFLDAHQIPLSVIHSSGHAYLKDLKRMAESIRPARLVPIHSFAPQRFGAEFSNVELHADGAWWGV